MLEYERKYMLTQAEYEALCQAYHGYIHTQVNYYYDTKDRIFNYWGITCRIRHKDDVFTATVKSHHKIGLDCSREKSLVVRDQFDDTLFKGMHVILQGCLRTERMELSLANGVTVAIDKNYYLGIVDYELEIEYSESLRKQARGILMLIGSMVEAHILMWCLSLNGSSDN